MKQYREVADTIVFPTNVDDALRQTIFDWYQFREICDDEKFDVFFLRVLKENINRYNQILRIQPGIAEYDWLVQRYLESQMTDSGSGTKETTDGRTTTYGGGTVTTFGGSDVHTTEYGKVEKSGGSESDNFIHAKSSKSGKNTSASNNISKTIDDSGLLREKTISGEKEVTTRDERKVHSNNTKNREGDFYTKTDGYVINDQKGLAKTNPMSISYSGGVSTPVIDTASDVGGVDGAGGSLDWSSPSSQTAQYGRDFNHNKTTDVRGTEYDKTETFVDGGDLIETTGYKNDYAEKERIDKTQTTAERVNSGASETASASDDIKETKSNLYTNENATSGSDSVTEKYGKRVYVVDERTQTASGSGAETSTTSSTHRLRHTGRYTAPAQLLSQAASFIMATDAWEWLYNRLDVCFMGIYD